MGRPNSPPVAPTHRLKRVLPPIDGFEAWRLDELRFYPNNSTYIVVTPVGLSIIGDLCPSTRDSMGGVTSYRPLSFAWFTAPREDKDYLCSKFLCRSEWTRENAIKWCEFQNDPALLSVLNLLRIEDCSESELYDALNDNDYDLHHYLDDGMPGYDYPQEAARKLIAIQERVNDLVTNGFEVVLSGSNDSVCTEFLR